PNLDVQVRNPVHPQSSLVRKLFPLLLLALVTFVAYAPVLQNGFVWDDTALVLRDPLIRSWRLIPEGFNHFLFTDATASDFYRPVQRLTYTLEYAAVGFAPMAYHLTSVVCHFAAAAALFLFGGELIRSSGAPQRSRQWVPFVASLAWALHPLHTSAVAYVSGRADPLAAAFGFLALYCALRSLRAVDRKRLWLWMSASATALLLSALSKEAGLIFSVLLLALVVLGRNWRALLPATLAAALVTVSYLALRMPAEHIAPPQLSAPAPAIVRPIIAARAFAEYAALILLPLHLHMERDVETQPTGVAPSERATNAAWRELQTLAGILLIAAFTYWLVQERQRDRALFVCLVLAVISYLPVSGVVRLNATIAEHWVYVPTGFLFLAFALAAARLLTAEGRWRPVLRPLLTASVALWMLFLGGRTFVRTLDWKDQRTFLERTIADGGESARMHVNLGSLEMSEGHLEQARKHFDLALRKEPAQPFAVVNRAALAVKQNDFKVAHDLLARATQMPAVEAQANELLAVLNSRETGSANLMRMRLASRSGAPNWSIEKRYINLLAEIGATEAAISELRHALESGWYRAESWQLLSELLTKSGHTAEATVASEHARRYDVRLASPAPLRG
ncbi:MAG: hypothetical protein M3Y80_04475, partial [Verrucomicrobiota bacterium]|nr:hypothetical protein [Verrucomicrobiota bacterium]